MKCPFCGHTFEKAAEMCASCPMHGACKATCCPNCGYEISRDSTLGRLAARLFKKHEVEEEDGGSSE